jgi:predicted permease
MFPREFRERHGRELERVFEDMCVEWEEERGSLGLRFWLSVMIDSSRAAVAEWLSLVGYTIRSLTTMTVGEHMSTLIGDVRFAIRQLARQPLYGTMIVLLMALGIAGNAAVFRVFNGLFLKPLPFENPELVVDVDETAPSWDLEFLSVAYRDLLSWQEANHTFQAIAAYSSGGGNLVSEGTAKRVSYLSATHDIDDVLRIEPLLGRFFGPEEDHPDASRVVLLSQGFWEQEFAGDRGVLGRTVSVNGNTIEIIGVLPRVANMLSEVDMWMPLRHDPDAFDGWGLSAIGRMNPGTTIEQAGDDLMTIHKGLIDRYPENEISAPVIHSMRERYLGDYRLGSGFLLAAVGIVLLIACANIAGLMTARSLARGPEMAVRTALGAPRSRIVRQLLTESVVLAAIGATVGAALGVWGSGFLVEPLAEQFPSWISFDLDARFMFFTLMVTGGAAVLFGLAPAWRASSRSAAGALGVRTTSSAKHRRGMSLLVAGEVALAVTLLVVGGLTLLDVQALGRTDPGFDVEGLVSYSISLPSQRYPDAEARTAFGDRYLEQVRSQSGVVSAALASDLPLGGHWGWFFVADGAAPRTEGDANPVVLHRVVSEGYFETVGVEFAAGRPFDAFDGRDDTSPVIIVNETFARTHLAHLENPIGARVSPGTELPDGDVTWMTVIGVTRDVKHYGMDEEMRPGVYQPMTQFPLGGFAVALKTQGDISAVMSEVRALTSEVDVEVPVYSVQTLTEELDDSLWTRRATSWLIAAFSTVALLLAIAGIYGVISYSVSQRRQEIGIRMAMGAQKDRVVREVVGHGMRMVGLGAVVGLGASLAGANVVAGILVGVSATNPMVYATVTVLVLLVAMMANYVPARRAAGLDPMSTLRRE